VSLWLEPGDRMLVISMAPNFPTTNMTNLCKSKD
jgi:hypothetical protein